MNFKNIEKFLKKNYKKIIVICLIMLLLSNKMYEKFTTAQALDAVKSTESKVNNMFHSVDANWIRSKKGIYSEKEIKSKGAIMSAGDVKSGNGKVTIGGNGTIYAKRINIGGTEISSFKPSCRVENTGWKDGAHKENRFLDRLQITCGDNEYMKSYKYHSHGNNQAVTADCCKLPGL
jgi:hypothetical protein